MDRKIPLILSDQGLSGLNIDDGLREADTFIPSPPILEPPELHNDSSDQVSFPLDDTSPDMVGSASAHFPVFFSASAAVGSHPQKKFGLTVSYVHSPNLTPSPPAPPQLPSSQFVLTGLGGSRTHYGSSRPFSKI